MFQISGVTEGVRRVRLHLPRAKSCPTYVNVKTNLLFSFYLILTFALL